jgi:iron-sulfur cluster repair protein YtfE (RIC family)
LIEEEEATPNPRGEALVEELRWVHNIIRSNLATVEALVLRINEGAPAEEIREEIDELAHNSALWTLRVNCLRYCSLVHHHHKLEDTALFPRLRRVNPALCPVIDRLEADHNVVAEQLEKIEAANARIMKDESARVELANELKVLSEHLLAHLEYEEVNISPTLRRLDGWPLD